MAKSNTESAPPGKELLPAGKKCASSFDTTRRLVVFGAESKLQESIVLWAKTAYPELRFLLFYVNNNSSSARTGAMNKRLGTTKGVFDLVCLVSTATNCGFCMDVKAGKNRLTKEQERFRAEVEAQGFATCVAYSLDEAKAFVNGYMTKAAARKRKDIT